MAARTRVLVVDDDDDFRIAFRMKLQAEIPQLAITDRAVPDVAGEFDVYFLDNQFGEVPLASDLVRRINATNPRSLVIAMSGRLDADLLKQLINEGCNGAFEKGNPKELARTLEIVKAFVGSGRSAPPPPARGGLGGAVRSIADLIREWNTRLDKAEPAAVGN